uniref:Uncharacterized protein n=1 Tax=Lactuca sativa TaxID=4236 RepID=A0A9R1V7Z9_LACSA|nr:hypothetical protein LSAT_V11C600306630 [Lactuca sativa]
MISRPMSFSKGDLFSPFLFILAMEGLNASMKSTCQSALFRDIQIPNNGPPSPISVMLIIHAPTFKIWRGFSDVPHGVRLKG